MPEIVIRTDGSAEEGMGHLVRSVTLAYLFSSSGKSVGLWCESKMAQAEVFSDPLIELFPVSGDDRRDLERLNPQILITDLPPGRDRTSLSDYAKEEGLFHVGINDLLLSNGSYDLCVNPTIVTSETKSEKLFSGPQYAVLNSSVINFSRPENKPGKRVKTLFISMGGTDPGKLTEFALSALLPQAPTELQVSVVLNRDSQNMLSLQRKYDNLRLIKHPENIGELLGESDLAVISGGITLYEACYLGIPSIVLPQNRFQQRTAIVFQERNAAICIGINDLSGSVSLIRAFEQMLTKFELRKEISEKGKALIDGNGGHRIVRLVIDSCQTFKERL